MSKMIGSWEIEHLDNPSKCFVLSRSYLDASIYLCEGVINGGFPSDFSSAQVIMGLCHHSVELFYKGIIYSVTGKCPSNTHNLFELEEKVKKLAPTVASRFSCPFAVEELPFGLNEAETKTRIGSAQDQQFRYQFDQKGNPWEGVHGFMPQSFLEVLNCCLLQYDAIISDIKS